jgi:hypothetical protein
MRSASFEALGQVVVNVHLFLVAALNTLNFSIIESFASVGLNAVIIALGSKVIKHSELSLKIHQLWFRCSSIHFIYLAKN